MMSASLEVTTGQREEPKRSSMKDVQTYRRTIPQRLTQAEVDEKDHRDVGERALTHNVFCGAFHETPTCSRQLTWVGSDILDRHVCA